MKIKKHLQLVVLFLLIACLFCSCVFDELSYSSVRIGENFHHNVDGYFKKIPHNYCIWLIELSSTCAVFKVPENLLDTPFLGDEHNDAVYNAPKVLEGYFVKGYYNENYLILCEFYEDQYRYVSLDFTDQIVNYHHNENDIYELFDFCTDDWFKLCNNKSE